MGTLIRYKREITFLRCIIIMFRIKINSSFRKIQSQIVLKSRNNFEIAMIRKIKVIISLIDNLKHLKMIFYLKSRKSKKKSNIDKINIFRKNKKKLTN